MRLLLLFIVMLFVAPQVIFSQSNQIVNFGSAEGAYYLIQDGLIDQSGNHIVYAGHPDGPVISFHDENFVPIWTKQLDSTGAYRYGDLIQLKNGKYLATVPQHEGVNGQLFQFDAAGNILWHKDIDGTVTRIVEIDQNNIAILTQYIGNNLSVINDSGDLLWSKEMALPWPDQINARDLIRTNDDHLMVLSTPYYYTDTINYNYLAKFNFDGDLQWEKNYVAPWFHFYTRFIQANDGHIYAIGRAVPEADYNESDMMVSKFSEDGDLIASKTYGYTWNDAAYDIIEVEHGNFLISGMSKPVESCGGNFVIMKLDQNLDTIFTKFYGQAAGQGAFYFNLHKHGDVVYTYGGGSMFTTIGAEADVHLIKTDSEFELSCGQYEQDWEIHNLANFSSIASPVEHGTSPIIMTDFTTFPSNHSLAVQDACSGELLGQNEMPITQNISLYPNPSSGSFQINLSADYTELKVAILSVDGKTIYQNSFFNGALIDIHLDQKPGIYFVNMTLDNQKSITEKVIIR